MSVLVYNDNYEQNWGTYIHGHLFWTADLGFLKTGLFWLNSYSPHRMFWPWNFVYNTELNSLQSDPLM